MSQGQLWTMIDRAMRRDRHSGWVLLLLPLLVGRLLLAPGVMPGRNDTGATLVVCDYHQAGSRARLPDGTAPASNPTHPQLVCPFAVACPPAPTPTPAVFALQLLPRETPALRPQVCADSCCGPRRSQSPRGPPA